MPLLPVAPPTLRESIRMAGRKFVFVLVALVMSIVNLTVFGLKTKCTLLPWQIFPLHPTLTFQKMYNMQLKSKVAVSQAKDAMDLAEPSMVVLEVIKVLFGHFVKCAVEQPESSVSAGEVSTYPWKIWHIQKHTHIQI